MRWDSDDAFRLYVPLGLLFVLGFVAKMLGVVGFVLAAGGAFLISRYVAVWIRQRFNIESVASEDRLDVAMRQDSVVEAFEVLVKGQPRP